MRVLVADVFVVIAGAIWFGVAVVCHSRGIEAPLNLFQSLWEPVSYTHLRAHET